MMKREKAIYQLTIEDVQNIALEDFGRELSDQEMESIIDKIADRIPWYDAIYHSISEIIPTAGVYN
jgi:uncharacterized membrane protein